MGLAAVGLAEWPALDRWGGTCAGGRHLTTGPADPVLAEDRSGGRKAIYRGSSWQSSGQYLENVGPLCKGFPFKTPLQCGDTLSQSNDLLLVATGGLLFMFDFLNPAKTAKKA